MAQTNGTDLDGLTHLGLFCAHLTLKALKKEQKLALLFTDSLTYGKVKMFKMFMLA